MLLLLCAAAVRGKAVPRAAGFEERDGHKNMYLNKIRQHSRRVHRFSGLLTGNPVLSLGLALPFAIASTVSLQAAFCIFVGIAAVTLPMMLLSALAGRFLPTWLRFPLFSLCAAGLLIPLESFLTGLFPVVLNSIGLYFPIIAVNTLLLFHCEKEAERGRPLQALLHALLQLSGLAVVLLLCGAIREAFGNGSLWGISLPFLSYRLGGLLIPFGGCIVAAMLAAAARYLGRLLRISLYRSDLKKYTQTLFEANEQLPEEDLLAGLPPAVNPAGLQKQPGPNGPKKGE